MEAKILRKGAWIRVYNGRDTFLERPMTGGGSSNGHS